jgi:hypothetical protein
MAAAAEPMAPPPVEGVTLEQYAGVSAALLEGFGLREILANEQIAPEAWPKAEIVWKARIAKDGPEGPLFTAFREKRATAEDCLGRGVAPIDSELGAWMSFLRAYAAHPAPGRWMVELGLGVNDLARLQRRWAERMEQDQALTKQAAELAKRGPSPLPALRVDRAKLALFPWSRGREPEAPQAAPRVAAPVETSMAPGKLRLYAYVAVKARLAESPGNEQQALEQLGMTDFAATDAGWQTVLRDNPDLQRDYQRLLALQRAKLRAQQKAPPPQAPKSEGTREAAPPVAMSAAPMPRAQPVPVPEPLVPPAQSGLPAVKSAPAKLAGTALTVGDVHKPALPFVAVAAPPVSPPPSVAPPERRDLSGTALALDIPPSSSVLPFAAQSAAPAIPRLTLEQHASLCCEITEEPEHAMEALARYHLTPAEKEAIDRHYAERFTREPALRTAWDTAYAMYRTWWLANRISR